MKDFLLLTPGPTKVPDRVLAKCALPMIHHRTKEFQAILERINGNLPKAFATKHPVLTFASSGTGAMDSSITNLFSKGQVILSFSAGKWGERYRDIARSYGLDVKSFEKKYGEAFTAAEVEAGLKANPNAKGVLMTLCETSTAVVHPIESIAKVTRGSNAILMIDAISGLGCDVLKMDEWGVDVVVSGSQKGFMLPPGLAFVALGERAQARMAASDLPKFYFHFAETLKMMKKNDTPFTPAVSLMRGLDEALSMMLEEGVEAGWKRHARIADHVRKTMKSLGLEIFAKAPSNAVTAVNMPNGFPSKDLINFVRDTHHVVLADGQGELQGKIIRFSHMGATACDEDAKRGLDSVADAIKKLGVLNPV